MKITLVIIIIILTLWFVWSFFADKGLESPTYSVIKERAGYELRKYDPYIVAETTVAGNLSTAAGRAFNELGGYIFGNNVDNQSISMTTPVTTEQKGATIAMTSPVTTERTDTKMTMSFMMPSQFTIDNLPVPKSDNVSFRKVESSIFAVTTFSGWVSEKKRLRRTEQLQKLLQGDGVSTVKEPQLLQYDRPFKFPLLRKNEIKIEVRPQ